MRLCELPSEVVLRVAGSLETADVARLMRLCKLAPWTHTLERVLWRTLTLHTTGTRVPIDERLGSLSRLGTFVGRIELVPAVVAKTPHTRALADVLKQCPNAHAIAAHCLDVLPIVRAAYGKQITELSFGDMHCEMATVQHKKKKKKKSRKLQPLTLITTGVALAHLVDLPLVTSLALFGGPLPSPDGFKSLVVLETDLAPLELVALPPTLETLRLHLPTNRPDSPIIEADALGYMQFYWSLPASLRSLALLGGEAAYEIVHVRTLPSLARALAYGPLCCNLHELTLPPIPATCDARDARKRLDILAKWAFAHNLVQQGGYSRG